MADNAHFSVDEFGVPGYCLILSDEFYGALGRVAALGALVESRMSDVIVAWTSSTDLAGRRMSDLVAKFEEIKQTRANVPARLVQIVDDAGTAMQERNRLTHSLWPAEDKVWKHEAQIERKKAVVRPYSTSSTDVAGIHDVVGVIARLVAVIRPLGDFTYTPIDSPEA